MDFSTLPRDNAIKAFQFTNTLHTNLYPSVDPTNPDLSQAGKVVIITGAGKGLGQRSFAVSFAKANPKALVLVGRHANELAETEALVRQLNGAVQVLSVTADVTDEAAVTALFEKVKRELGTADVLVNNAGVDGSDGPVRDADPSRWWKTIDVNVRGTYLVTRAFLQLLDPSKPAAAAAAIIDVASLAALTQLPGGSAYGVSKLAVAALQQFVAAENPRVTAVSLHPGVVPTDLTRGNGAMHHFAIDPPELAGGVAVWLATPAARFLSGRYVDVHWSVDELVRRRDEIVQQRKLLTGLNTRLGEDAAAAAAAAAASA